MNRTYIGRKDKVTGEEQLLIEHLCKVSEICGISTKKFTSQKIGNLLGYYHDLGKYSDEFQFKIKNASDERVDHSTAGCKLQLKTPFSFSSSLSFLYSIYFVRSHVSP
jgi:CRISPR-associated endonuclease/helicase Cas3